MESLRELYRIGAGPSSSHTMAPKKAAQIFADWYPGAANYKVTLYASLAATGKGHLTDAAIMEAMGDLPCEIIFKQSESLPEHPNGMLFEAMNNLGETVARWTVYSVGGGALKCAGLETSKEHIYPYTTMKDILAHLEKSGQSFSEYVFEHDKDIADHLKSVWLAMETSVDKGIKQTGTLPGGLGVSRRAHSLHRKLHLFGETISQNGHLATYAYAVAEENASGGTIVTAPTCGASGVLPAVLKYLQKTTECTDEDIINAIATAGLIGNLIKENASISGAEVGCQGEIGSACAMAAAAATQLLGGSIRQIEYAAEMGVEHLLGLTCDPVGGLVQIPCIERNAHAAVRALGCAHFALLSDGVHKITFDEVMAVMMETGQAIPPMYRETSEAGLADKYRKRN